MQVKLKNAYLQQITGLLFDLVLKGKQSRHRTKLITLLEERYKEVEEQRVQLAKEHSHLDEDDKPVTKNGSFDIIDFAEFKKELNDLLQEEMVIGGGDCELMLNTMKEALLECEQAFSGKEALIYDYLCDQFERED